MSLLKGPGHPPAAPALPSTRPSAKDTTVTETGHNLGHQNRTNKHKEGVGPTLRTKPQLSPTCASRDSEAEEAGCLMASALARTNSGARRAGLTHHQGDP